MKNGQTGAVVDVRALALAAETLQGNTPVSAFKRLAEEMTGKPEAGPEVTWSAVGESRATSGPEFQIRMHLEARVDLPMTCQRCLEPVLVPLEVDCEYRFVADEKTASEQDDESEEDVLVYSREFNLLELIEDELLMELPIVPRHDVCPADAVPAALIAAQEAELPEERPNPFAVLGKLRGDKED